MEHMKPMMKKMKKMKMKSPIVDMEYMMKMDKGSKKKGKKK